MSTHIAIQQNEGHYVTDQIANTTKAVHELNKTYFVTFKKCSIGNNG